ncbi:GNAT family N-acetyltransferase [Prochlorococcus sp. AH-716-F13]|nr:GNAT family N-acetyltransferase [Prochlorococcus sp. AH-716-F13]
MQDKKIKIRFANPEDKKSIFNWRNNKLSREMFFESQVLNFKEHSIWFNESLANKKKKLYIGEVNSKKIGICRFDFKEKDSSSEVSINMNPEMRSLGLSKRFLFKCIEDYLSLNDHELFAKIKSKNKASLKIFDYVGFNEDSIVNDIIYLRRPLKKITFKKVDKNDIDILFKLLINRKYSISHKDLPTMSDHLQFIKSNKYLHWAIIYENKVPIGTFYIQNNNSVGLNLLNHKIKVVFETVKYIKSNFKPLEEIKSQIPSYFYFNVAYKNEDLKNILIDLENIPIQTSFKIT